MKKSKAQRPYTSSSAGRTTSRGRPHAAPRYLFIAALGLSLLPDSAMAQIHDHSKTVAGLTAYLGLVPGEIVRGHPGRHREAQAHGGPPRGEHVHHAVIALFDATSGARVEDAKVTGRVSSVGLAGPRRTLELMKIADTVTCGNYSHFPRRERYRIDVEVERPHGTVAFEFIYDH